MLLFILPYLRESYFWIPPDKYRYTAFTRMGIVEYRSWFSFTINTSEVFPGNPDSYKNLALVIPVTPEPITAARAD